MLAGALDNVGPDLWGLPEDVEAPASSVPDPNCRFDDPHALIRRAWYQRQRNPEESHRLRLQAEALLITPTSAVDHGHGRGRLLLIAAEELRLQACAADARMVLAQAERQFRELDDPVGLGDCAFMLADIQLSEGQAQDAINCLSTAVGHYARSGDRIRQVVATAWLAFQIHYNDPAEAQRCWSEGGEALGPLPDHPAAAAYTNTLLGGLAFRKSNFPDCIRYWITAFESAMAVGAAWLSVHLAMNIGSAFANLYDLSSAMEWKERAHGVARSKGWPEPIGTTLASMAETTTSIGQADRARSLFEEALTYLGRLTPTRRHVISYNAYGSLCLKMGDAESALQWFRKAQSLVHLLAIPDLELPIGSGIATALLKLGRTEEAAAEAERARAFAVSMRAPFFEVEALRAQAAVCRVQHADRPDIAIAILEDAVGKADILDGLVIHSDMSRELALSYEAAGDFQKALFHERRMQESWQKNFDRENGARILAMQVRFDTARAKAEAEHHRRLAAAEAARAVELDRANKILERLGSIGQEITARLDSEAVFVILSQHLYALMPVNTVFLGLKDDARQVVDIAYRMEDGRRLPPRQVELASDTLSARCVRDNEEIIVTWREGVSPATIPGTRHMRTVLYRPLTVGDRVLGVVSVQSDQPDAYGPREMVIFRTICAYGAIAMANAAAYQQVDRAVSELREALQRLVQQEKMAALGQLVSGVAHEVNTPLGVTLSAVSQLNDNIRAMRDEMGKGVLTRASLADYLESGQELAALAQRNVARAADMVRTFKGVAVDHGSDERRRFELGEYIAEIVTLMKPRTAAKGHRINLDIPTIFMDTYPGALAQAVTNLIANVDDHAYEAGSPGPVSIKARRIEQNMVEITVADSGKGIPPDVIPNVFNPFFTTRRAEGSMGLGLHVAFNQITQRLNGTILVESVPDQGTVATIRIPCDAPGIPALEPRTPAIR